MAGFVPVARIETSVDHKRSAFGRYIAESLFWTPAALLPSSNVIWDLIDEDTARVTVTHDEMVQSIDLSVDESGKPIKVAFPRWSDANSEKVYQIQPFGGYLSQFKTFHGFRLPTHIEAGNFFGTEDYFPFFVIDVSDISFPRQGHSTFRDE